MQRQVLLEAGRGEALYVGGIHNGRGGEGAEIQDLPHGDTVRQAAELRRGAGDTRYLEIARRRDGERLNNPERVGEEDAGGADCERGADDRAGGGAV